MKRTYLGAFALTLVTACGGGAPPAQSAAAEPPATAAPAVPAPAPLPAPSPTPEPTPEEKKAAEEKAKLEADWVKMLASHQAESARLTPALIAEAKPLFDQVHPSGRAAIKAALAGKHRKPGNSDRDVHRHPVETLDFLGFSPSQTVLEYGPGEGWYTELLSPSLYKRGALIVTSSDPNAPRTERPTLYAERLRLFLARAPDLYGKVGTTRFDPKAPVLDLEAKVDLALVIRGLHGMVNAGTMGPWLAELHDALRPGAILGIVQHRGKPEMDPKEGAKLGYLPEKWVIAEVEAAGFKLLARSEVNANPKDTKDHPEGVWALPPSLRHGDKDREKYLAIGESDRMTLKFQKVKRKLVPAAAAPAAKPTLPAAQQLPPPTGAAAAAPAPAASAPAAAAPVMK